MIPNVSLAKIINTIDANKNGRIEKSEVNAVVWKNPQLLKELIADTNLTDDSPKVLQAKREVLQGLLLLAQQYKSAEKLEEYKNKQKAVEAEFKKRAKTKETAKVTTKPVETSTTYGREKLRVLEEKLAVVKAKINQLLVENPLKGFSAYGGYFKVVAKKRVRLDKLQVIEAKIAALVKKLKDGKRIPAKEYNTILKLVPENLGEYKEFNNLKFRQKIYRGWNLGDIWGAKNREKIGRWLKKLFR